MLAKKSSLVFKCFRSMKSYMGNVIPLVALLGPITMDNLKALAQHSYDVKSVANQLRFCNSGLYVIFLLSTTAISFL